MNELIENNELYKTPMRLENGDGSHVDLDIYSVELSEEELNKAKYISELGNTEEEIGYTFYSEGQVINPPLQKHIYDFIKTYNQFGNCVNLLATFIIGSGSKVTKVRDDMPDNPQHKEKVNEIIENIYPDPSFSFTSLMERKTVDNIVYSYSGDEVIYDNDGGFYLFPVPVTSIRITKRDRNPSILTRYYKGKPKLYWWKFRRYAQWTGEKHIYYKELFDVRAINKYTGLVSLDGNNLATPMNFTATGYTFDGSPYTEPLWQSIIHDLEANYEAKMLNKQRFKDGFFNPFMVLVSGGTLTEQSWKSLKNILTYSKGRENAFKIPIIEVSADVTAKNLGEIKASSPKVEFERFQHTTNDMMNVDYLKYTSQEVRQLFGIPDIIAGLTTDYNRATADTAYDVFNHKITPFRKKLEEGFQQALISVGIYDYKVEFVRHKMTDLNVLDKLVKEFGKFEFMPPNAFIDIFNTVTTSTNLPHVKDGDKPYYYWRKGLQEKEKKEKATPITITDTDTDNNENKGEIVNKDTGDKDSLTDKDASQNSEAT